MTHGGASAGRRARGERADSHRRSGHGEGCAEQRPAPPQMFRGAVVPLHLEFSLPILGEHGDGHVAVLPFMLCSPDGVDVVDRAIAAVVVATARTSGVWSSIAMLPFAGVVWHFRLDRNHGS